MLHATLVGQGMLRRTRDADESPPSNRSTGAGKVQVMVPVAKGSRWRGSEVDKVCSDGVFLSIWKSVLEGLGACSVVSPSDVLRTQRKKTATARSHFTRASPSRPAVISFTKTIRTTFQS